MFSPLASPLLPHDSQAHVGVRGCWQSLGICYEEREVPRECCPPPFLNRLLALGCVAGKLKPNLGRHDAQPEWGEILKHYRGSELQNYFTMVCGCAEPSGCSAHYCSTPPCVSRPGLQAQLRLFAWWLSAQCTGALSTVAQLV